MVKISIYLEGKADAVLGATTGITEYGVHVLVNFLL